jgi:hypothetical protein
VSKVIVFLLLDLVLQVEDKAIGRHLHTKNIRNGMLKDVIDENAQQFNDWHCHDSPKWVELMIVQKERGIR